MVLSNSTKSSQAAFSEGTLELESGMKISYVAPAHAAPLKENSLAENSLSSVPRKRSFMDGINPREEWEGVCDMCYALDHAVRFETDDLVKGRKIGFCTALPSVFAIKNGAKHITLHSNNNEMMESCVKPTLSRNKIKNVQQRTLCSSLEDLRKLVDPNEFDVILAVEFFNREGNRFEEIHDFIDYALANDGVCLLESRMFCINCESSLHDFLDLVKSKGKFDVYTRWSTPKSEIIQRRVIQLTRAMR
uniref:Methyltransferase type 11 domain-containing protein n=1 Tax=Setaria digitata TaxID=48799 RepID=A0A915PGJ8_9BILA